MAHVAGVARGSRPADMDRHATDHGHGVAAWSWSRTLLVSLRFAIAPVAILVLMGVGLALRAAAVGGGWSDVMLVTDAAIRTMLEGSTPYGIGYAQSIPPGAPFAYGPIALLWYLPGHGDPGRMETAAHDARRGRVSRIRGRPLGLALYATLPPLLVTATDGSNDTSAGVLLLVALLAPSGQPIAGGALLAVAAAFKPYAVAWLLPLLAYGGIAWPLAAFLVGSVVAWGWAVLAWGPRPILDSLAAGRGPPRGALLLAGVGRPGPVAHARERLVGRALRRWACRGRRRLAGVRTARSFVLVGSPCSSSRCYAGWWSTFAYLAALAPVVCWHLDDWLGLGDLRVRWPADPVGRVHGVGGCPLAGHSGRGPASPTARSPDHRRGPLRGVRSRVSWCGAVRSTRRPRMPRILGALRMGKR